MAMAIAFAAVLGFLLGGALVTGIWLRANGRDNCAHLIYGMLTQASMDVPAVRLREMQAGMSVLVDTREIAAALRHDLIEISWAKRTAS
jgi:hypothetical protein